MLSCTFLVQFQEHLFSACSKLQLGVTLGILLGDDDNVRLGSLPGDTDGKFPKTLLCKRATDTHEALGILTM